MKPEAPFPPREALAPSVLLRWLEFDWTRSKANSC